MEQLRLSLFCLSGISLHSILLHALPHCCWDWRGEKVSRVQYASPPISAMFPSVALYVVYVISESISYEVHFWIGDREILSSSNSNTQY